MQRWEYQFVVMDLNAGRDSLQSNKGELNGLGQDGWEVVQILTNMGMGRAYQYALVKRPVPN